MSTFVIVAPNRDTSQWKDGLQKHLPDHTITIWPEVEDPDTVSGVACWNHPHGSLKDFKNLKLISSLGAGVDHVLSDPDLPVGVPVTRIVDQALTYTMSRYLLGLVLSWHRRFDIYRQEQATHTWNQKANPERNLQIGIMGMGVLGRDIAENLVRLGFEVYGYSRSKKEIDGVTSFAGEEELQSFLNEVNLIINLLPLTKSTQGILDATFFNRLPRPVCLINAARGGHLVEEDLISALDNGKVEQAFLDVFQQEPLPSDHAFWDRKDIFITPHIASITNPDAAIPQIANNWLRAMKGEPLRHKVNRSEGY
ncbi:2-hydroxyacid dehydrogenase [Roseivirga sp. BDSF3-8]|uniref:2-hydroxyacid dehydrogenase n=1 Tax=Roseivirga sp. BDSF3-8 TaxID=3241598 RepID=UPI003531CE41